MSWVGPGTFIEHRKGMNFIALGQILTHLLGFKYPYRVHWGEIFKYLQNVFF